MLWTKVLRIRSVSDQDGSQNFESVEDSLKDLIAYATMNIEWIREQNKTPEVEPHEELDKLRGRQPRNAVTWRVRMNVHSIRNQFGSMYVNDEFVEDKSGCRMLELIGSSFIADAEAIFGTPNRDYVKRELEWYESKSSVLKTSW